MKPQSARDFLADRLRREAGAERPAFSGDLHRRIMRSARDSGADRHRRRLRWLPAAAAIGAVALGIVAMRWHASGISPAGPRLSMGGRSEPISPVLPTAESPSLPANFSLNLGSIATVRLQPPQIVIGPLPAVVRPAIHGRTTEDGDDSNLKNLVPPSLRQIAGLIIDTKRQLP